MEKYYYTKPMDSNTFQEAVNLRTTLRKVIEGIQVSGDFFSETEDDNIEIVANRALTSAEQDEITNLVNTIDQTYDLYLRAKIEKSTMSWAMTIGKEMLCKFSSNNLYRGKSDAQVDALVENYPHLIHALLTGSLTKAYREFISMVPDENISQEEIDEFALRLLIILGQ